MIRNLKALGLALATVFAIGAVAASAASAAQGFLTSDGPVTLNGVETGAVGANQLTAFGIGVECPGSTYTGHKYNVTPHQFIPTHATTFTLTPDYNQPNCQLHGLTLTATVTMNGCDYVAHLGETNGPADTYNVTYDIVCTTSREDKTPEDITIEAWTAGESHNNAPVCVIHIPEQAGLIGGVAKDTTNGTIDLTGTVKGIHATETASTSHPSLCPGGTTENAKFDIDANITGRNEAGGSTEIGLSEEGETTSHV
jgi:hypothetical protein